LGTAVLSAALPAFAAGQQASLPKPKTEGAITYLSGGIGQDEAAAMKQAERDYPLSMIFTEGKRNEYLADVQVSIKDHTGKTVLQAPSNGPIMLVKLPHGQYQVTAQVNGKALHRTAKVADKGDTHLWFMWPSA